MKLSRTKTNETCAVISTYRTIHRSLGLMRGRWEATHRRAKNIEVPQYPVDGSALRTYTWSLLKSIASETIPAITVAAHTSMGHNIATHRQLTQQLLLVVPLPCQGYGIKWVHQQWTSCGTTRITGFLPIVVEDGSRKQRR
jgi:hypothetical protein